MNNFSRIVVSTLIDNRRSVKESVISKAAISCKYMHVGIKGQVVSKSLDDRYGCGIATIFPTVTLMIILYNFP